MYVTVRSYVGNRELVDRATPSATKPPNEPPNRIGRSIPSASQKAGTSSVQVSRFHLSGALVAAPVAALIWEDQLGHVRQRRKRRLHRCVVKAGATVQLGDYRTGRKTERSAIPKRSRNLTPR